MKQNLLLVSAAMMLCGSVFAADWTKPTPVEFTGTAAEVDGSTEQYLYNVETKAFFLGANDWNTRASVSVSKGYKVRLTPTDEVTGTFALVDFVETQNAWKKTFVDGPTGIWVDNDNGANANNWYMIPGDGVTFKISNYGFEGQTLGVSELVNDAAGDTRLYMSGAEILAGAFHDTWMCVSAEEYESKVEEIQAYGTKLAQYEAAVKLGEAIAAAKAKFPNIDLTDEQAVYDNLESTVEELNAATASVEAKVRDAEAADVSSSATAENPVDLSMKIVNSTFDVIGDFHGWAGSSWGAGGTTGPCAERYQMKFDTWQEIDGLPNGVYALNVAGFYRCGGHPESLAAFKKNDPNIYAARLYATNMADEKTYESYIMNNFQGIEPGDNSLGGDAVVDADEDLTYYVPNSMAAAVTFFEAGKYAGNTVMFAVSDGKAKIGVKKDIQLTYDWVIVDNFGLTYYGGGADAYQLWMKQFVENAPNYDGIEFVTTSVLEAYQAVVAGAGNASTYDEVQANIAAIEEAKAVVDANIAAWNEVLKAYNAALEVTGKGEVAGPAVEELSDYLMDVEDVLNALEMGTEELLELAAKLNEMTQTAIRDGLKPGSDFTSYLKNPAFSTGDWTGWEHTNTGGASSVNATAKCAEAWNSSNFDIYQIVEGAPVGVYEISMQGFYREGRGDNAWNLFFDEAGDPRDERPVSTAFVYLNDAQTPLTNVFGYQVPVEENFYTGDYYTDPLGMYTYPNNMTDAGLAFDRGAYQVSAFGLVAEGQPMRIGVHGRSNNLGDSWAIFDNFKLTYQGFDADIIKGELQQAIAAANYTELMGSDVKAEVAAALATANEALTSDNGRTMFDALAALLALNTKVEASVALFKDLQAKWDALGAAISVSEAAADVKAEASELFTEVATAIQAATYTDAQATEKIEAMMAMISKLAIPAGVENATDENPVSLTTLLATPSFQNDNYENSVEGWTYDKAPNFGNDATQKGALAVEYYQGVYDIYQDVAGLPEGVYGVSVNAFYRYGSTDEDFAHEAAGEDGLAKMYVVTTEGTTDKAVTHLAHDAQDAPFGMGAELEHVDADGNVCYIPNDMVSAACYFEMGLYQNEIFVEVKDGKLRLGMKQEESVTYGWMIMDNWQLTYYGKESSKLGIENIAEGLQPAKAEMFNLNGQRINALQPGMNIVRYTMSDGSVKVSKIFVK